MTPEETIARGAQADALLKNSLLSECFETVLSRINKQWLATKRESGLDREYREELHARANAITELRGELQAMLTSAAVERSRIEAEEKRKRVK